MEETDSERYDRFVRGALNAGFTDDQTDFLEHWFSELFIKNLPPLQSNYSKR